jgi:hypothetical protein
MAAALLVAAMVLNNNARGVESWIVPDDAVGPFVIGLFVAVAAVVLELRATVRGTASNATVQVALAIAVIIAAVIGGLLAIAEPFDFNAGYGCLGSRTDVWLAAAMRPTPATCGYLIPASDDSLFYPAAYAAFGAAAFGVASGGLSFAGRARRAT